MRRWCFSPPWTVSSTSPIWGYQLIVSDTKLMGKAFVTVSYLPAVRHDEADFQDIVALGPDLAFDKNGRRTLLYTIVPTSTKHYIPDALKSLAISAAAAREAGTSKKDPETRRKELKSYANEGLLKLVEDKGEEMVREPAAGLVVQEIMLYTEGGAYPVQSDTRSRADRR